MVSAQSLSNGPTLHPVKFKGGVERGVPFMLLGCRLIFTTLEQVLLMAMKQPYVTRAIFLGQKAISCGELNPLLARCFWESIGCSKVNRAPLNQGWDISAVQLRIRN